MRTQYMFIAAALALSACSPDSPTNLPPGQYQKTTSNTDAVGNKTDSTKITDVAVDANGNKTAVVKTKTTQQPPGVLGYFDKTTTQNSTQVYTDQ